MFRFVDGLNGGAELENIIKQVIESEYRAQRIIEEVENERKQAAYNIEKEIGQLKADIFSLAEQKAETVKSEKLKQAQAEAAQILSLSQEKALLMIQKFEKKRNTWVERLFNKVLERG